MKRMTCFFLLLSLFAAVLSGCGGGNISQVQMIIGQSQHFSEEDIEAAMEVAMKYFRKEFDGCTMTKMEYDEEKSRAAGEEWARTYADAEGIVLYSSFDVDASGGDGSLNPNSTYTRWQWVLTRSEGGNWVLRTWGYG